MTRQRRSVAMFAAIALLCALPAYGQDAPSVADAARQARLQKQKRDAEAAASPDKDVQGKREPSQPAEAQPKDAQPPKAKKVITNDEIPQHIGPTSTRPNPQTSSATSPQPSYIPGTTPAEYWKNQIQALKDNLTSLRDRIDEVAESLRDSGGNCISDCVQQNLRQQQKQQELEMLKNQLAVQKRNLGNIQDMARKQGFGSSVYDP